MLNKVIDRYNSEKQDPSNYISDNQKVIRDKAISELEIDGFPGKRDEEYKYTFITKKLDAFLDNVRIPSAAQGNIEFYNKDSAIELTCINGVWSFEKINALPEGLEILSFQEAEKKYPEEFKAVYNNPHAGNSFKKLNTAFNKEGVFIHVAKSKAIEKEVILHILSDSTSGKILNQPRVAIYSAQNSELKVIEKHLSSGANEAFTNFCTDIYVERDARLSFYDLQLELSENFLTANTTVHQEEKSVFTAYTYSMSGQMVRNNLDINLNGEYIESNMYGAYVLDGKTHVDNHTSVNHAFPNCESNELYKGIMFDKSTAVFNGKIFVRQDAQKTNAFQSNRNLLLSNEATVHTKPQLEIWADDVKCSHGATIGQLDDDQLFYLRARGIPRERAIALLTQAFAEEVIEKVDIDYIREYLEEHLDKKFN